MVPLTSSIMIVYLIHVFRYDECNKMADSFQLTLKNTTVKLTYEPFQLDIEVDQKLVTSINSKGLMNFEHYREKQSDDHDDDVDGLWGETFCDHYDSKPRGPSSVGLDISFLGFDNVYGIPEHADSLALRSTGGETDPYRLFNLDVFGYSLNNGQGLYGSVPYMIAHSAQNTVGLFWMNASETWVDVDNPPQSDPVIEEIDSKTINTHWISESGIIDVFVLLGPKPHDVFRQYAALTGPTTLPPMFAIAYHQCRWNYNDQEDVETVDGNFDKHEIPYDVIWLDIEHTNEKRYFTWDLDKFPSPKAMQEKLASKGRKLVTIIDPHIKKDPDYHMYQEISEKGYFIKNIDNNEYEGKCWPEMSCWVDFLNPEAREWWGSKFMLDQHPEATLSLHIWNDMNEPAVFGGPELTAPKDTLHHGDWEHRDVHNLYGFYNHMSTYQGMKRRTAATQRPFVLSRSFFAGSQRFGPIWTGDNKADWSYLKISLPMVLSLGICGIAFAGADVGGFLGNPEPELLLRWYQAGAFQPFFRAHAEFHTDRREPWLYDDVYKNLIREALCRRYALLPFWYTLFFETTVTGTPVVRPLWVEYPDEKVTYTMDDQYLIGKDILVKPVTSPGQTHIDVYLPGKGEVWYDCDTNILHNGCQTLKDIETPLGKIPVFQRGGSIIPRKDTQRPCSEKMRNDPYKLIVALNIQNSAEGQLYMDDEESFDYQQGSYALKKFTFANMVLKSESGNKSCKYATNSKLEHVVILGVVDAPQSLIVDGEEKKSCFSYNAMSRALTVDNLDLNMNSNWTLTIVPTA